MIKIGDYNTIMNDHNIFNQIVYTPLSEALKILEERQKDKTLKNKVEKLLNNNIPEPLKILGKYAVQSRQIATLNYDTRWFIDLIKDQKLRPVFLEYLEDKLTSNNDFKHSLGILRIHEKTNKNGDHIEEKVNIVNFSKDDGKKIKDVLTIYGESLVNLHHRLFNACGLKNSNFCFYDASSWFKKNGPNANDYYKNFLLLFVCHGIFFENFLLTGSEGKLTKEIFLPAFEKVSNLAGVKPLIVPIPPMENENDIHWFSYKGNIKQYIKL